MSRSVAIEPIGDGFVIRQYGVEQVSRGPLAKNYFPSAAAFHFATIDQARAFCAACDFTWSVTAK